MTHVWKHSPHSGSHLLMLLALADQADDDGKCGPGITKLAQKTRMSPKNAQRLLKELESNKSILVLPHQGYKTVSGNTNSYVLVMPEINGAYEELCKKYNYQDLLDKFNRKPKALREKKKRGGNNNPLGLNGGTNSTPRDLKGGTNSAGHGGTNSAGHGVSNLRGNPKGETKGETFVFVSDVSETPTSPNENSPFEETDSFKQAELLQLPAFESLPRLKVSPASLSETQWAVMAWVTEHRAAKVTCAEFSRKTLDAMTKEKSKFCLRAIPNCEGQYFVDRLLERDVTVLEAHKKEAEFAVVWGKFIQPSANASEYMHLWKPMVEPLTKLSDCTPELLKQCLDWHDKVEVPQWKTEGKDMRISTQKGLIGLWNRWNGKGKPSVTPPVSSSNGWNRRIGV